MSITTYAPSQRYTGAGNLAQYTFAFKIQNTTQLLVVVNDLTGAEIKRVRGTDATYLSSVTFDPVVGGGKVTLLANLPTGYIMTILLANDAPTQPFEFKNKSDFTLSRIESALDFIVGALQRVAYKAHKAIRLNDADIGTFEMIIPPGLPGQVQKIPMTNQAGTGWESPALWVSKPNLDAAVAAALAAAASATASATSASNSASSASAATGSNAAAIAAAAAAQASATSAANSKTACDADAVQTAADRAATSTYAANASTSSTTAQTAATNAGNSATSANTSASNASTSATNAANSATAAANSAAAAAGSAASTPSIVGSAGSPTLITAAGGINFTGPNYFNYWFIQGNGGNVDITKSPQITAGTVVGQMLELLSQSDSATVLLEDGTGLSLNGAWWGEANKILGLIWDGNAWRERFRR